MTDEANITPELPEDLDAARQTFEETRRFAIEAGEKLEDVERRIRQSTAAQDLLGAAVRYSAIASTLDDAPEHGSPVEQEIDAAYDALIGAAVDYYRSVDGD